MALLAFHSKCLRLLQISGTGKSFPPDIKLHVITQAGGGLEHIWMHKQQRLNAVHLHSTWQIYSGNNICAVYGCSNEMLKSNEIKELRWYHACQTW